MSRTVRVVVVGAGIGGLTTAARLAQAGLDVTVLEAHVYAGGCAGTFYHKGYRFDAGATVAAGFYPGGPMDLLAQVVGIANWPMPPHVAAASDLPEMVVHLSNGEQVKRWADDRRHDEHRRAFGASSKHFWQWQERCADALWQLALQLPPWPPQSSRDLVQLLGTGLGWLTQSGQMLEKIGFAPDLFRPLAAHLQGCSTPLRQFVDGQLLIAAQATSEATNALYGASALDLPRRGIVHLPGGMGAIAQTLVQAVKAQGGKLLFRQEVTSITKGQDGLPYRLETKRGEVFEAEIVVGNLPHSNLERLCTGREPSTQAAEGWGAFMLYLGVAEKVIPPDLPLHHQVIVGEPMGEGNTIFLSISPSWDATRAPAGMRAITISTHTNLRTWWQLKAHDPSQYGQQKARYTQRVLQAAERVLPGLSQATQLVLPGTPVTFQRFTRRDWGWVGGYPQTTLFRTLGPRYAPNLWMVGDSIFPGQSTAAVALGGLRVAQAILCEI